MHGGQQQHLGRLFKPTINVQVCQIRGFFLVRRKVPDGGYVPIWKITSVIPFPVCIEVDVHSSAQDPLPE